MLLFDGPTMCQKSAQNDFKVKTVQTLFYDHLLNL